MVTLCVVHPLQVIECLQRMAFNAWLFQHILFYVAEYAVCIQHNFTTLQEELPPIDVAICMLKQILDRSNISDIEKGGGRTCQKSKLIKIILMKGMPTCEDFVTAIQQKFERTDFVRKMEMHNDDVTRRGNHLYFDYNVVCHIKAAYDISPYLMILE